MVLCNYFKAILLLYMQRLLAGRCPLSESDPEMNFICYPCIVMGRFPTSKSGLLTSREGIRTFETHGPLSWEAAIRVACRSARPKVCGVFYPGCFIHLLPCPASLGVLVGIMDANCTALGTQEVLGHSSS